MENKNTELKTKISGRVESDIKLRLMVDNLYISGWKVWPIVLSYGLLLRDTHRYTTLPDVRPHQSATLCCIKFSRLNAKKEENSHKPNHTELHQGKRNVKQVQDKAKSSGNRVEKSFIYK